MVFDSFFCIEPLEILRFFLFQFLLIFDQNPLFNFLFIVYTIDSINNI